MTKDDFSKAQVRTMQYNYVDGTFELSFGGICLLWAGFMYMQASIPPSVLPEGLIKTIIMMVLFMGISLGGAFLINRLTIAIKEHLTYPRTGYVAYQRPQGARRASQLLLMMVSVAAIAALFAFFFGKHPALVDWMSAASGIIFALAMCFVAWRTKLQDFYLIAGLSVIFGLWISTLGLADLVGLALYYGSMGVVQLIAGAVRLWVYLHENPAPSREEV